MPDFLDDVTGQVIGQSALNPTIPISITVDPLTGYLVVVGLSPSTGQVTATIQTPLGNLQVDTGVAQSLNGLNAPAAVGVVAQPNSTIDIVSYDAQGNVVDTTSLNAPGNLLTPIGQPV